MRIIDILRDANSNLWRSKIRSILTILAIFIGSFTIILNTIQGVQDISRDFYNAARSMGAGTLSLIKDIVIPGSLPGVLTGLRLAIGLGWMSVI